LWKDVILAEKVAFLPYNKHYMTLCQRFLGMHGGIA